MTRRRAESEANPIRNPSFDYLTSLEGSESAVMIFFGNGNAPEIAKRQESVDEFEVSSIFFN